MLIITFLIIITSLIINSSQFWDRSQIEKSSTKNTILTSLYFFVFWIIIDHFFYPNSWFTVNISDLPYILAAALLMVVLNILLYKWYLGGSDYIPLYKSGIIRDGCSYSGSYSIPANFITHAAQVLYEEILFRGIIGLSLYFWIGELWAILIPSILFGLAHYLPFKSYSTNNNIAPDRYVIGALISTSIFPAFFMMSVIYWESLVPAWIMHTFLNCSVGLYMRYINPRYFEKIQEDMQ